MAVLLRSVSKQFLVYFDCKIIRIIYSKKEIIIGNHPFNSILTLKMPVIGIMVLTSFNKIYCHPE